MERSIPKSPHLNKKTRRKNDYQSAKPLPPTPTLKVPSMTSSKASSIASSRTPSTASLSSVYTEDIPATPRYVPYKRETFLPPPKIIYEPFTYRSSTSMVPDPPPQRPKPKRGAMTETALQKPAAVKTGPPESLFSEWRAPKYEEIDEQEPRIPTPIKILAQKTREMQHIAEQHADDYRSILPQGDTRSDDEVEPYYEGFNSLPAPMSPRITDVVDATCVPRPLRMSTALDSNTSSHFSSSSSELMVPQEGSRGSLKSRAKKAFHSRKYSQEKSAKKRINVDGSSKLLIHGERNEVNSMTPSERASIQQGIIEMYDTLTSLYDPSNRYAGATKVTPMSPSKHTIDFPPPKKAVLRKDHKGPILQETPYHEHKRKSGTTLAKLSTSPHSRSAKGSWLKDSPTNRTPKRSHFSLLSKASSSEGSHSTLFSTERKKMKSYSFPHDKNSSHKKISVGVKWKKAVGFEKKKGKKSEGEKRRDSMKKKIVIVRAVAQGPFSI